MCDRTGFTAHLFSRPPAKVQQVVFTLADFYAKMPLSKRDKILIAIASLVGLVILIIVVERATNYSAGLEENCPSQVKKCNEKNQLYHLGSQQCLQNGRTHGLICGNNMVISPLMNCRIQGECECDYKNNERHLVYDDGTDQCYPIYSQGSCEDGYIVSVSSNGKKLKCRRDICVEEKSKVSSTERDSIVPYENKCYVLSNELNEPGCKGKLKFWKGQVYPSCSPSPTYQTGGFSLFANGKCQPGSWQAFTRFCTPMDSLTFGSPGDNSEEDMD